MKNQINWEDIYTKMSPRMLGICRRYVNSTTVAEDLMHEAYITAIKKVDTYTGKGSFEGWICKIAVNTSLQYLRERKKNKEISIDEHDYEFSDSTNDENQAKTQKNIIKHVDFDENELLEVIDKIPGHHKMVFNLYVFEAYKHKQIGKMLDISPGTSKSHLARARKKIQQLLYEKALNKNELTDKKKNRKLLMLFFFKPHYIDSLYRNKLSSYAINPKKQIDIQKLISEHSKSQFFTLKTSFLQLFKTILITVSTSAVVVSSIYFYNKNSSENIMIKDTADTTNIIHENIISEDSDNPLYQADKEQKDSVINKNIVQQKDSINNQLKKKSKQKDSTVNNAIKNNLDTTKQKTKVPPVIIRKKVIIRDTIYE